MNSQITEGVFSIAAILKVVANIAVFIFLVWSMYFATNVDFGILKGIIAFILLGLFIGFIGMFPFGTTFAPIFFEWWWHDVSFWQFSTAAWSVTAFSMAANVLVLAALLASEKKS